MSRFREIIAFAWLACKRNALPRDLRKVICNIVSDCAFDWESEQLRVERASRWSVRCHRQESRVYYLCRHVTQVVERWQELPFGVGEDASLHLERMLIRQYVYSPMSPYWRWVH